MCDAVVVVVKYYKRSFQPLVMGGGKKDPAAGVGKCFSPSFSRRYWRQIKIRRENFFSLSLLLVSKLPPVKLTLASVFFDTSSSLK
jgi:hypothetical protein